jgi:hypothetical protein
VTCRAQRAIRQRTKDHIESLTRRIEELTQTSDLNARLNQALQRNEELVQENKSIRDKLNSIVKAVTEGQRECLPIRVSRARTRPSPLSDSAPAGPAAPPRGWCAAFAFAGAIYL